MLELTVACAMLGVMTYSLFLLLNLSFSQFQVGTGRIGLQGDLHRCLALMERDLEQSSIYSTQAFGQTVALNASVTVHRDGMCFAAVNQTSQDANYDIGGSGKPKWNCYTIYYGSQDTPGGLLVRLQVSSPTAGSTAQVPLSDFLVDESQYLTLSPINSTGPVRTLCTNLYELQVSPDVGNQTVTVEVGFIGQAGHMVNGQKTLAEVVETTISVYPKNTVPKM